MQFINPRTDYAFKRIFGSEESKPILQNFLNAFLYEEQEIIQSLEIIDPYLAPKLRGMKDTFVDVQATLANGTQVIIEMQVLIKSEVLNEIENREMFIRAQQGVITKSFERGIEEGKREQALEIARNLIPLHSDEMIAQITALSINNIVRLRTP